MSNAFTFPLHVETQGDGPPLVFVHGLGATSNIWHAQRVTLSRYFRVIVYDRSGAGRSTDCPAGYSIDGWADELAALLDHLQIASAIVVGHSLGSMVAQRFASRHAQRTTALVLAGGEAELDPKGKAILEQRVRQIEAEGLLGSVDGWLSAVLSAATREANPALAGLLREMFLGYKARNYMAHALALRDGSVVGDHANIRCPTLLVVGDQDLVTPLRWQQEIAARIADSRIRVVPDTAHMTMLESPRTFNTVLLEFFATLPLAACP